mgnify:CR=1 FL=1|jgi:hypothetical protein
MIYLVLELGQYAKRGIIRKPLEPGDIEYLQSQFSMQLIQRDANGTEHWSVSGPRS